MMMQDSGSAWMVRDQNHHRGNRPKEPLNNPWIMAHCCQ
jgi:hypothetical protein